MQRLLFARRDAHGDDVTSVPCANGSTRPVSEAQEVRLAVS